MGDAPEARPKYATTMMPITRPTKSGGTTQKSPPLP